MEPPAEYSRRRIIERLGPRQGQDLSISEHEKSHSSRQSKFSSSPHDGEGGDVQQQLRRLHSKRCSGLSHNHRAERSSPPRRKHVKPSEEDRVSPERHHQRHRGPEEWFDRSLASTRDEWKGQPNSRTRRRQRRQKMLESPCSSPPAAAIQRPRGGKPGEFNAGTRSPRRRHRHRPAKSSSFQSRPEQLLQVYKDLALKERLDDRISHRNSRGSGESGIGESGDGGESSLVIHKADDDDNSNSLAALDDRAVSFPEDISLGCRNITASTPVTTNIHPEEAARKMRTYRRHESLKDGYTLASASGTMASKVTGELKFSSQDSGFHAASNPEVHKMGPHDRLDSIEDSHTLAAVASTTLMVTEGLARPSSAHESGSLTHFDEASSDGRRDGSVDQVNGCCLESINALIESFPEDISPGCRNITASTPVTTNIHPEKAARKMRTYRRHESLKDGYTLATAPSTMASKVTGELKFSSQDSGFHAASNPEVHKMGPHDRHGSIEDSHTQATVAGTTSMVTEGLARPSSAHESGSLTHFDETSSDGRRDGSIDQVDGCYLESINALIETRVKGTNQYFSNLKTPSFQLLLLEKQIKYLQHKPTPLDALPPPTSTQQLMGTRRKYQPPWDDVGHTLEVIRRRREVMYVQHNHSHNPRKKDFGLGTGRRLTL